MRAMLSIIDTEVFDTRTDETNSQSLVNVLKLKLHPLRCVIESRWFTAGKDDCWLNPVLYELEYTFRYSMHGQHGKRTDTELFSPSLPRFYLLGHLG
jgi:hypothetical protein